MSTNKNKNLGQGINYHVINGQKALLINQTMLADEGRYKCIEGRAALLVINLNVNGES